MGNTERQSFSHNKKYDERRCDWISSIIYWKPNISTISVITCNYCGHQQIHLFCHIFSSEGLMIVRMPVPGSSVRKRASIGHILFWRWMSWSSWWGNHQSRDLEGSWIKEVYTISKDSTIRNLDYFPRGVNPKSSLKFEDSFDMKGQECL